MANNNLKIAKVYVEKDAITCECVCALYDVSVGDYVQIFLNNAPTVGEVKELTEVHTSELSNSVYDMKSIIRKVANPNKTADIPKTVIAVDDLITRNKTVTVIGMGILGRFDLISAELEAFKAEPGDVLYFQESYGSRFRAYILGIHESTNVNTPVINVSAVRKTELDKKFFNKNQISVVCNDDERKATLKVFRMGEEEFVIGDAITNIANNAFERERKLKKLILATVGLNIESMAFSYNESIEEIVILDRTAEMAINCFDGCRRLKKVILPYTMYYMRFELWEYYGNKIEFVFDMGTDILHEGVVYTKDMGAIVCCIDENIEEYRAPMTVGMIYPYAFKNCSHLKKFIGSPYMKETGYGIFAGCMGLKEVQYRYEDDYDVIMMFGRDYCEDGKQETIKYKNGTSEVYYLPRNCKFSLLPKMSDVLEDIDPREISPAMCNFIGKYYDEIHKTKEAIKFHSIAAFQGFDESYQKLAEYAEYADYYREYFTVDLYDYAHRVRKVRPFFNMIMHDFPEYAFEGKYSNDEILEYFMDRENLVTFLKKMDDYKVFDTDLLNFGLNPLYNHTEDIHDLEIKKLFFKVASKVGYFDNVMYWMEDLLEEIFVEEKDFREFGFHKIKLLDKNRSAERDEFINSIPEGETKDCIVKAYNACLNIDAGNIGIFKEFIDKAKETGDEFYQNCAILSIFSYMSYVWTEKHLIAQFRTVLDLVVEKYNEGASLLGILIMMYKANMKRNIPKRYYLTMAEKLYDRGLLMNSVFDNLLGKNVQENVDYFCKYPEYYNMNDRHNFYMRKLTKTIFYVSGKVVTKPANSKVAPLLYLNYVPDLIDGKLNLFINPHEGMTFYEKNGLDVPEEFFELSLGQVLSILYTFELEEATLFPVFLNKKITAKYINSTYDRR